MTGRWPANVILSPDMAEVLDGQSGNRPGNKGLTGTHGGGRSGGVMGNKVERTYDFAGYGDDGGASRFFLTAGYEPWELEWILANGLVPYTGTV